MKDVGSTETPQSQADIFNNVENFFKKKRRRIWENQDNEKGDKELIYQKWEAGIKDTKREVSRMVLQISSLCANSEMEMRHNQTCVIRKFPVGQ